MADRTCITSHELKLKIEDIDSKKRRREMDHIINTRFHQTPEQKRIYEEWYKKQVFKTEIDKELFDMLPLTDTEKMEMVEEMRK